MSGIRTIVTVVALFGAGAWIWNTDAFQKRFFPKEYWEREVRALEDAVAMDQALLRDAVIELKKVRITMELTMAQETNGSKLLGIDPSEARAQARRDIQRDILGLKDDIAFFRSQLRESKAALDHARSQLAIHDRTTDLFEEFGLDPNKAENPFDRFDNPQVKPWELEWKIADERTPAPATGK